MVFQDWSGWGGRDRTFECWNQNPVPYHLATPQQAADRRGWPRITARPAPRKPGKARPDNVFITPIGPVAGPGGHRYKGASRGEGPALSHWFGE